MPQIVGPILCGARESRNSIPHNVNHGRRIWKISESLIFGQPSAGSPSASSGQFVPCVRHFSLQYTKYSFGNMPSSGPEFSRNLRLPSPLPPALGQPSAGSPSASSGQFVPCVRHFSLQYTKYSFGNMPSSGPEFSRNLRLPSPLPPALGQPSAGSPSASSGQFVPGESSREYFPKKQEKYHSNRKRGGIGLWD